MWHESLANNTMAGCYGAIERFLDKHPSIKAAVACAPQLVKPKVHAPKRTYTPQFKALCVADVLSGKPAPMVAREQGVTSNLVRTWVNAHRKSLNKSTATDSIPTE